VISYFEVVILKRMVI